MVNWNSPEALSERRAKGQGVSPPFLDFLRSRYNYSEFTFLSLFVYIFWYPRRVYIFFIGSRVQNIYFSFLTCCCCRLVSFRSSLISEKKKSRSQAKDASTPCRFVGIVPALFFFFLNSIINYFPCPIFSPRGSLYRVVLTCVYISIF